MRRFLEFATAAVLTAAFAGGALAQTPAAPAAAGASAAKAAAQEDLAPGPAQGGIQGQNIFDVKPEVKRDASNDPGYMEQSNGERNRVQPGNNAPMWRGVQAGKEGYSSLPKSQAPEAGILIQAPVQYPGSRLTTAGEAWRQVRNHWIIPYGAALAAAGCAEKEQTASGTKSDTAPHVGTNRPFVASGWKPGDKTSWEQQLKTRTVQGQNDYAKVP